MSLFFEQTSFDSTDYGMKQRNGRELETLREWIIYLWTFSVTMTVLHC